MAWFRVDDAFGEHAKVLEVRAKAGWAPIGLWLGAGTWANRHLTDGFIPRSWIALNDGVEHAEILVDAGLWIEDAEADGYRFKDYTDYQPSKAEVEEKRAKTSAARSAAGKKSGASRRQAANKPRTNREQTLNPVPDPVPVPTTAAKAAVVTRARSASAQRSERSRQRLGLAPDGGSAA